MVQGEIPERMLAAVEEPMINVILGCKTMTVGDRTFDYDPATCFVIAAAG